MAVKYICPICGRGLGRVAGSHLKTHNITAAEFHRLRLERDEGKPIRAFLRDVYYEQKLTTPEIYERYGITYRVLREIMQATGMEMRTAGEGVAISWEKGDDSRRDRAGQWMKELSEATDMFGDNNPAKHPDVRRKISEAKKRDNPGLMPMLLANRKRRLKRPSSLERKMARALAHAGIPFVREYQVGRYFIDFALVPIKVAIECDGSRWHDLNREKDRRRDNYLRSWGWLVLRYRGEQIKSDIDACIADIVSKTEGL